MFKVITMSDSNYFNTGSLFLKTRNRIDADFVLYGPDLNKKQIKTLTNHDIEYIKVDGHLFKTTMQYMKFDLIIDQMLSDKNKKYKGFTLADFDTFFINDWKCIFNLDFDYGITVRKDMISKKCLRAYANGGVVFCKHASLELLKLAKQIINDGKSHLLPEYDIIWNTLEKGRPANKTHFRNQKRWWVDQCFLSAIILNHFNNDGYHKLKFKPFIFSYLDFRIGMFICDNFNVLDSSPDIKITKNIFIRHLKSKGRDMIGAKKTVEKL